MQKKHAGFTLVELSIVLVILGLLVGGVLSGQSLIHAAELRSVVTERDKYTTALHAFKDKYFAYPGDMPNAYAFWGKPSIPGCSVNGIVTDVTQFHSCNGNGDGIVGDINAGTEIYKSFMHLSLAGLVEGNFTQVDDMYLNVGATKIKRAGWLFVEDYPGITPDHHGAKLWLMLSNSTDVIPDFLSPDAWNIDKKTDDGYANRGGMRGTLSCMDRDTDGDIDNGEEDAYGLQYTADSGIPVECGLAFLVVK